MVWTHRENGWYCMARRLFDVGRKWRMGTGKIEVRLDGS